MIILRCATTGVENLKDKSWSEIGAEAFELGAEGWQVLWLRSARLMQGGETARREAQLMVSEKIEAHGELGRAILSGELGSGAREILGGSVGFYLNWVRGNRKRLSRGR